MRTLVRVAVATLLLPASVWAEELGKKTTGIIARDAEKQIQGLRLTTSPSGNVDDENPTFSLEGEFRRPGWTIAVGRRRLKTNADGAFQITLPVRSERFSLVFTAQGPNQAVERERVEIRILDWEVVKQRIAGREGDTKLDLTTFRAYSSFNTQSVSDPTVTAGVNVGLYSFTGGLSWNPQFRYKKLAIRGNLGLQPVKKIDGGYFLAVDYNLALAFPYGMLLHGEVGYGAQTWVSYSGTYPLLSFGLLLRLQAPLIAGIKAQHFFISLARLMESTHGQQLKLGLSFSF